MKSMLSLSLRPPLNKCVYVRNRRKTYMHTKCCLFLSLVGKSCDRKSDKDLQEESFECGPEGLFGPLACRPISPPASCCLALGISASGSRSKPNGNHAYNIYIMTLSIIVRHAYVKRYQPMGVMLKQRVSTGWNLLRASDHFAKGLFQLFS